MPERRAESSETTQAWAPTRRAENRHRSRASRTGRCKSHTCNGHFGRLPSWRRRGRFLVRGRPAVARATKCRAATSDRTGRSSKGYREQPKVPPSSNFAFREIASIHQTRRKVGVTTQKRPASGKRGRRLNRLENHRTFPPKRPLAQPAYHDATICAECAAGTVLCDTAQLRDPILSVRPARGCTAPLPQTATPVSTKARRKFRKRW